MKLSEEKRTFCSKLRSINKESYQDIIDNGILNNEKDIIADIESRRTKTNQILLGVQDGYSNLDLYRLRASIQGFIKTLQKDYISMKTLGDKQ